MKVKEHYDNHLGNFYSWMVGDFRERQAEQENFFRANNITPGKSRIAIDLGCGHGLQSVSLANIGFTVIAVDFNKQLLHELNLNKSHYTIEVVEDDIVNFLRENKTKADVIACMGDTLTHLESHDDISAFVASMSNNLESGGKVILSFRELNVELEGHQRFIPVKSDENKILMCFLEYFEDHVMVHDVLYVWNGDAWQQKISAYPKLRISEKELAKDLERNDLRIEQSVTIRGLKYLIAGKR